MEINAKCPKCHSELERITGDSTDYYYPGSGEAHIPGNNSHTFPAPSSAAFEGLGEGIIRCKCKKCKLIVEVSIGEP
jgi:phage FluMu protein Com